MSLTRRGANVLQWAQKRAFRPRAAKVALLPHYEPKQSFDYSETEPVQNWEKACVLSDSGANYEKSNDIGNHFRHQEEFVNHNGLDYYSFFGGMYGRYWPAHFGGGYLKFLRRRSDVEAVYKDKNPFMNWYRRKCDERGIHMDFPRGQDYQIMLSWFVCIYIGVKLFSTVATVKGHFANAKPLPPPDTYPPRINLPFYVYIIHEINAPNFEE